MKNKEFVRGFIEGKLYDYVPTGFNLSYEDALIQAQAGAYISRLEWDGFHFIDVAPDGERTYIIVLKTGEMLFNPSEIYDVDKKDWGIVNIINKHVSVVAGVVKVTDKDIEIEKNKMIIK